MPEKNNFFNNLNDDSNDSTDSNNSNRSFDTRNQPLFYGNPFYANDDFRISYEKFMMKRLKKVSRKWEKKFDKEMKKSLGKKKKKSKDKKFGFKNKFLDFVDKTVMKIALFAIGKLIDKKFDTIRYLPAPKNSSADHIYYTTHFVDDDKNTSRGRPRK